MCRASCRARDVCGVARPADGARPPAQGDLNLNICEAHAFNTLDRFSLDVFVVNGWTGQARALPAQRLGRPCRAGLGACGGWAGGQRVGRPWRAPAARAPGRAGAAWQSARHRRQACAACSVSVLASTGFFVGARFPAAKDALALGAALRRRGSQAS